MKKWICLFVFFAFLQASAQYSYTYTDPCTLQSKSVFVPAGGGVVVNYFDNHNTFSANDFSSGAFDSWIAQVSQQNSNSPCQSVTTAIVNTVSTAVVSNTVSIVTNVVSISSLAQTMASVMTSATGGSLTSTAESISNSNTGGGSDSTNENNSNESTTGNNTGGSSTNVNSNKGNSQSKGNQSSVQGSGTNTNNKGGTTSTGDSKTQGSTSSGNNSTQGGEQKTGSSVEGSSGSGNSGNTANSVSNSIDGGSSDGSSSSTAESSETKESKSGGGSNLANSLSNAADGGSADSGGSSGGGGGGGSKKESSAKASTGALIASGDMVVIANADTTQPNQYKFVGSITHANTRGTRIKGVLFNYTTVVNNFNVTFYKSYVNKSRKLNTVIANSTMMNTAKDIFNTTTALESYKITKKITGMFGLNLTGGKLGEREFYNISAVVGGHAPIQVTKRVSTSILVLGIYSPFTQFYEGQWWSAGVLVVPFNSWDLKITKTFKFNISATAVYSYGESFLNYQVLTGGKINF